MIKICKTCRKEFRIPPKRKNTAKYCSRNCQKQGYKGVNYSPATQFKEGHHYNLGIIRTQAQKDKISKTLTGRKLSQLVIKQMKINARRGSSVPTWKGDNAGYVAIHIWLKTNYGKADRCEFDIDHKSKYFEWALIKGKTYIHNRNNFMQLCLSCHRKYDGNGRRKEQYATS